jgi:hypothetical protein
VAFFLAQGIGHPTFEKSTQNTHIGMDLLGLTEVSE